MGKKGKKGKKDAESSEGQSSQSGQRQPQQPQAQQRQPQQPQAQQRQPQAQQQQPQAQQRQPQAQQQQQQQQPEQQRGAGVTEITSGVAKLSTEESFEFVRTGHGRSKQRQQQHHTQGPQQQQQGPRPQQQQQQQWGQQQGPRPQQQQQQQWGQQQGPRPQQQPWGQQQGPRPQQQQQQQWGQQQGPRPRQQQQQHWGQQQGPRPQQQQQQQWGQQQGPRPQQQQQQPWGEQQGPRPQQQQQQPWGQQQGPRPQQQQQQPWGQQQGPRPQQQQQQPWEQQQHQPPPQAPQHIPGMPQLQQQKPKDKGGAGRGKSFREGGTASPGQQSSRQPSPTPSTAYSVGAASVSSVKSADKGKSSPKPQEKSEKVSIPAHEVKRLQSLIPKRKNPNQGGTKGRKITVETNMIPIIFNKNFKNLVIQYDVKFDPDKPKFMYRPTIEAVRMKHYPNRYPVYDGRAQLYSAGTMPFGDSFTTDIAVFNPQRQSEMTFKVTITKSQEIDMSWLTKVRPGINASDVELPAIHALDVVLRAGPLRRQAITVGRSFFSQPDPGRVVELGNGLELWVGSFQSAVLGWKPYFNIDVAHKGFPRHQPVLDLMKELCGDPRSREVSAADVEHGRSRLVSYLKGLKVTYEIPGQPTSKRTMGINDLGKPAREATFELDDHSVTTVENYFARVKRYKVRRPDLPTLWVGSKNKLILIPPELCIIDAGQVTNKKMDERQTSTMIKYAATDANTRRAKIMDGFAKMRYNEDPAMKEFGVSLSNGFETVNARVLEPPSLTEGSNRNIIVRKGVWRASNFHTAMVLPPETWTILNLDNRMLDRDLQTLKGHLQNGGRQVGMSIGDPIVPFTNMRCPDRNVAEIREFFFAMKQRGVKLIIVVVPDRPPNVYGKVKQVAELNVGVLTQCLKSVTVQRKMSPMTAGNILLKINSKLNGVNQIFTDKLKPPCLMQPCLIVGADVTHPSPDSVGIPSIAAVAASYDPQAFRYNVKIRLQPPKKEIIESLEEIMREQLLFFYKRSGQKPTRIIFYRDGVSEGQFPQVMHYELQAIRNACSRMSAGSTYQPKITFLVVQKRHHIRLFPTDPKNSDDRNGNVQAGTVVDTQITHPSHIDFYLVSHASIQGTARPTKYRCLWDDNDMSEDEIEQLTYYLCHMFSRCTRSVSYPTPTYYAHLAAFRARALTNEVHINLQKLDMEQQQKMTIKDDILLGNPMFFV